MEPKLCCSDMEQSVAQAGKEGVGMSYHTGNEEGPHFYLQFGRNRAKEINFCPWCGRKVSIIATL